MANISPGTLCLIIGGPAAGQSVTVEYIASDEELIRALNTALNAGNYFKLIKECQSNAWKLDKAVLWLNTDRTVSCHIPYEVEHNLLPIPPLNDESELFQFRQLETQS